MKIAVLPGDDIGPEITEATLTVLEAADRRFGLNLGFESADVGMTAHRRSGTTLPADAVAMARSADGIILGPCGACACPPSDGGINVPRTIREALDLYANIRPARSRPALPRAVSGLDCVIVRDNGAGLAGRPHGSAAMAPGDDGAFRGITAQAARRIAEVAFAYAERRRGRITVVGKRDVLPLSDGLFLDAVRNEALLHPNVSWQEMDIDAMAAALYTRPGDHDVILTTSLFGDMLASEALALAGSLGLAQSLNTGTSQAAANAGHDAEHDAGHGPAPGGAANPAGLMLSAAMLMHWLGERRQLREFVHAAIAIEAAADKAMLEHDGRTAGGRTRAFTSAVVRAMRES